MSGGAELTLKSEYFVINAYTPRKRPIDYDQWTARLAEWKIETRPKLAYFKIKIEEFLEKQDTGDNLTAFNEANTENNLEIICGNVPAWESYEVTVSFKELPDESVRRFFNDKIEAIIAESYEDISRNVEAKKYAGKIRAMDGKESDAVSITSVWFNQPLLCEKCEHGRAGADGYFDISSRTLGMSVRISARELHDVECHDGRFDQKKIDVLESVFADMEE